MPITSAPKLLVIDDEVDICELIAELADDKGLEVRTVSDSEAVADLLATFTPDAIMLDLMMPGTDGVELLKTLADKVKGARIALMSGTDARVLNSARRLGSAHGLNIVKTLEKPLEIATIRAALDELTSGVAEGAAPAPDLGLALAAGQIQVFLQPVVSVQTTATLGLEVLPRWPQADGRVLTPTDFLAPNMEAGLLTQLTHDMFNALLPTFNNWGVAAGQNTADYFISFNVAPSQLNAAFVDWLAASLKQHNVNPARLALECHEDALLTALATPATDLPQVLAQLRLLGLHLWLDEFAARSSIAALQGLPLSGLKLAKELAAQAEEPTAQATIKAALALANALDRKLIAVGVETERQRGVLAALGVDGLQGNAIAAPFSQSALDNWFKNSH